jgi:hypothetical protein
LNQQNAAANAVRDGHILDPAIQKENIFRIADIATGTGYEIIASKGITTLTYLPASSWARLEQNSQLQGMPLLQK